MKFWQLFFLLGIIFFPFSVKAEEAVVPKVLSAKWVNHNINDSVYAGANLDAYVMTNSSKNIVYGWYNSIEGGNPGSSDTSLWVKGENNGDGSFTIRYTLKTDKLVYGGATIPLGIYFYNENDRTWLESDNDNLRLRINPPKAVAKTTTTTKKTPEVVVPKLVISQAKFIETCGSIGSTTILENEKDATKVDFKIDCPKYGSIHFVDKLNLSSELKADFLDRIAGALIVGANILGVDSTKLPSVGTGAVEVTINNLTYLSAPVLKAGNTENGITDSVFNLENKQLSFKATKLDSFQLLPMITVDQNSQTVVKSSYVISGKTNDASAVIALSVNNKDQGNVAVNADGTYTKTIILIDGKNEISIKASNATGVSEAKSITVQYNMPLIEKTIKFIKDNWVAVAGGFAGITILLAGFLFWMRKKRI
jgi:hypothetical protein